RWPRRSPRSRPARKPGPRTRLERPRTEWAPMARARMEAARRPAKAARRLTTAARRPTIVPAAPGVDRARTATGVAIAGDDAPGRSRARRQPGDPARPMAPVVPCAGPREWLAG